MGQYYKACIVSDDNKVIKHLESWDYDEGSKLMEHSWVGNRFVARVENQLKPNGKFYKNRIVWCGDYAKTLNFYKKCNDSNKLISDESKISKRFKYIVNHDTKEYVDKTKSLVSDTWKDPKTNKIWEYRIHPLPLLTCRKGCNGLGGGDFMGKDPKKLISKWERNHISIESRKPKGYTELLFDLVE